MEPELEISIQDAAAELQTASPPVLLDVRRDWEFRFSHVEGSILIPLDQLPSRVGELDRSRRHLVLCHHGVRSLHAAAFLQGAGLDALSIEGGIDVWSSVIDPSVPRY